MITEEEKAFIISFEGFSEKAYQLQGENFYTIGYGTARQYKDGRKIQKGDVITKKEAEEELIYYYENNIETIINNLNKTRKEELNTKQRMAICSLIYNCGKWSFLNSKCYKFLCTNNDACAVKEWDFGMYKVSENMRKGITKRRNKEIQLFFGISNFWSC